MAELEFALFKKMKGSSAPGIDGFQVNWLRKFWASFKLVTFYAINECYRTGTLTSPLRTGVIRLLRKGQKDPTLTGNYRPISLLSIHYKLASCCITQRLRPLVGKVIGTQQKAYVPGNIIGSCIVNLLNLMEYTERKKVESLILLIDFRKAFDSLSHRYIDECLKLFNFGPSIRKWVSLFFCNREAYILLGGELSKSILLEQGVPQGDVVSPYIFILAVEPLLIKINNTKHI